MYRFARSLGDSWPSRLSLRRRSVLVTGAAATKPPPPVVLPRRHEPYVLLKSPPPVIFVWVQVSHIQCDWRRLEVVCYALKPCWLSLFDLVAFYWKNSINSLPFMVLHEWVFNCCWMHVFNAVRVKFQMAQAVWAKCLQGESFTYNNFVLLMTVRRKPLYWLSSRTVRIL